MTELRKGNGDVELNVYASTLRKFREGWGIRRLKNKQRQGRGGLNFYDPTHRDKTAMDGAPEGLGWSKKNRQRQEREAGPPLREG